MRLRRNLRFTTDKMIECGVKHSLTHPKRKNGTFWVIFISLRETISEMGSIYYHVWQEADVR